MAMPKEAWRRPMFVIEEKEEEESSRTGAHDGKTEALDPVEGSH